ncbi:OmpA family protein, partial [Myxococcota bacterium]|nr:OmpA family protein [Myxococcota bacterium]
PPPAAPPASQPTPPASARAAIQERAPGGDSLIGWDGAWSADPGPLKTFRARIGMELSSNDDFPIQGAHNESTRLRVGFAWTPLPYLEAGLNVLSSSNVNDQGRPNLLQTQGDTRLNLKIGRFLTERFAVGTGLTLAMLSGMGTGGFEAFNFTLRGLMLFDVHRGGRLPLRLFLDSGYTFENSDEIYGAREAPPSLIEEHGLGTARYDRLATHIGVEVPASHWLVPYLEYSLSLPFLVELTHRSEDSHDFDFGSLPHALTLGLRSFPLPELALEAALRLGFTDAAYTGVPATPPWASVLALSYTLDPQPKIEIREVAPATPPPPPLVEMAGQILDAQGAPLEGARIIYPEASIQLTDARGRFGGYHLKPGPLALRVEAEGHKPAEVKLTLALGQRPQVKVQLEVDPAKLKAKVEVYVADEQGRPLEAEIALAGEGGSHTALKPYRGEHTPGEHTLVVSAKGYETLERPISLKGGASHPLRVQLKRAKKGGQRSASPGGGAGLVSLSGKQLRFRRAISFAEGQASLSGATKQVLNDLASVLQAHPEIKKIRVGAHTDNRGGRAKNLDLSKRQALAVRSYLATRGISARRVQAEGFGPDKPKAPNLTARGREKNRRVEIVILEMGR